MLVQQLIVWVVQRVTLLNTDAIRTGDEEQKATDVTHHVHGRQHQDAAGRLGDHGQRAL